MKISWVLDVDDLGIRGRDSLRSSKSTDKADGTLNVQVER